MKPFRELTIAELLALTPDEIDMYVPVVAQEFLANNPEVFKRLGRSVIEEVIANARKITQDLNG